MSIMKVENLTKKFGKFTVLDQINIELEQGEVFGFIGPNGAGKTTTIRSILGILKATEGQISVFGQDAWKDAVEIHKRVAFVPGDVSLWPNLTGGEVIDLFVKLRGNSSESKREMLIKRFDLDPSKKCRAYSKGNRQKVALVAALASDADLYVLDEPTSGLDPLMETVFQTSIQELKAAGKTIFLSSHILSEVEKLCDRVAIIREGKIIETGSLKELRHLMRNQVVIETAKSVTDARALKGVYDYSENNLVYSFQMDPKELSTIANHFNKFDIVNFESVPPTLEALFMHHYTNGGGVEND